MTKLIGLCYHLFENSYAQLKMILLCLRGCLKNQRVKDDDQVMKLAEDILILIKSTAEQPPEFDLKGVTNTTPLDIVSGYASTTDRPMVVPKPGYA